MNINTLTAISPIDGRYFPITKPLATYFSEYGLMRYRILVEIEYFIALCEFPIKPLDTFPTGKFDALRAIYKGFDEDAALRIKSIEQTTNHDVKALEYFIKEKFDQLGIANFKEFIHFGLTSQDINNTAIPLLLKEFLETEFLPRLKEVIAQIDFHADQWAAIPMLARTHGQPASPTRLGKEMAVFSVRLKNQLNHLKYTPHTAKFGGATGNFNAHYVAYPEVDWHQFGNAFVTKYLGLERSFPTTQIEHYDNLAALFDNLKRINTILIDYSRDIWQYVAMDYFKQKIKEGEVGSSAMPHKVNPIDFENAEGNLGVANALFEHMAAKLPISRLQRDLTDSTVLRNLGTPLAHTWLSLHSLGRGIGKLEINPSAIEKDLSNHWAVVAEAIQTILRKEGYPNPYEALKGLTRKNESITKEDIHAFIKTLAISDALKATLMKITPFNYTGL